MRVAVMLLLLANVILAAMLAGWLPRGGTASTDTSAMNARALHTEQLRLLPADGPAPASANVAPPTRASSSVPAAPEGSSAPAALPASSPAASAPQAATSPARSIACVEIGPLKSAEAAAMKSHIDALAAGTPTALQTVATVPRWWVHLPDAPSRAALTQQIARLRDAGVNEYYVLGGGHRPGFVLSLGLFNDEDRAKRFADALRGRHLDARIDAQPGTAQQLTYRVRDVDAAKLDPLRAWVRQQWPTRQIVRPCES